MPDYQALYYGLFNDVTDIIERLHAAQQKAEEGYISAGESSPSEEYLD
ncbi:hypothetical protein U6B65_08965 [Oscillospiraceae bacterium MB08-C2-2]|nr:hypothetical protein U6B65_08965 [Oscillospiraceae bacterium MB08-C2-2]